MNLLVQHFTGELERWQTVAAYTDLTLYLSEDIITFIYSL